MCRRHRLGTGKTHKQTSRQTEVVCHRLRFGTGKTQTGRQSEVVCRRHRLETLITDIQTYRGSVTPS